ncbi:MAG TPA: hypothetical protein VIU93_07465 [Gallionellaceae bacterium]
MTNLLSQVSYQVFLYCVFIFFMLAGIFSFIVGLGLALRSARMLRFIHFMNQSFSARKLTRPLTEPHFVEPGLLRHRRLLGSCFIAGAAASIYLLWDVDADVFRPVFRGYFAREAAEVLAGYTKSFLLIGNAVCMVIGLLVLFYPRLLARIEAYTDKWYTLRKQMRPLTAKHVIEVDHWVMAHPTVSGVTLSIMSLVLSISMYMRF